MHFIQLVYCTVKLKCRGKIKIATHTHTHTILSQFFVYRIFRQHRFRDISSSETLADSYTAAAFAPSSHPLILN